MNGTNSLWLNKQSKVWIVHGTSSPAMARMVYGTNSSRYEKSSYWVYALKHMHRNKSDKIPDFKQQCLKGSEHL